jgi:hypothetical protein
MVQHNEELVQFFKAFVDVERLKLVGVLAKGRASIQEMSDQTEMSPSETLRHMEQLCETGLVVRLMDGDQQVYELAAKTLEEMAKRQFTRARDLDPLQANHRIIPGDFTEKERKVLINYTHPNGEVKQIPLQQKKQLILLRYVLHHFLQSLDPGKRYKEKEINEIIKRFHPDAAFFRRSFVDAGHLHRFADGSVYWVEEKGQEAGS